VPIGIYIHIPFCNGKCPYCDFYSLNESNNESLKNLYTDALIREIYSYKGKKLTADTLYFGGGTPNLMGSARLVKIINSVCEVFGKPSEITAEVNPSSDLSDFFVPLKTAGLNRISVGLQSGINSELLDLGRKHTAESVQKTIADARNSGINNISVDIMVGIPNQTLKSLEQTLSFALSLKSEHISAYLLKIEEGTLFFKNRESLNIADEDSSAEMYEFMSRYLTQKGFNHYEISNFCKEGKESRHNLKYWHCEEYLGFGAAAHSFFKGKRYYYPRDIMDYIEGKPPVDDGDGGDFEEYAMLGLRLSEGISDSECIIRFGHPLPDGTKKAAKFLAKSGFVTFDGERIAITQKGFSVSNTIIEELIFGR